MDLAEGFDVAEELGGHGRNDKLVLANCQRWVGPPFAKKLDCSNLPAMGDVTNIETIRENLRRIMARKDVRPTTLSLAVGSNRTLVKDMLERNDNFTVGTLMKLAGALNVDLEELLARPRVAVAGKIGAGGQVIFEDEGEEYPGETVLSPPGVSGKVIALVVQGNSMLPKYKDGDVIYIQRNHEGVLPEYIGEDCAVRLATGETFIKQLAKGDEPGRFTLRSLNAPDMENVEVQWATPVLFIMPARARRMFS